MSSATTGSQSHHGGDDAGTETTTETQQQTTATEGTAAEGQQPPETFTRDYVERLRSDLSGMGVGGDVVDQYLRTLAGAFEGAKKEKEWRSYFAQFVERAMSGRT